MYFHDPAQMILMALWLLLVYPAQYKHHPVEIAKTANFKQTMQFLHKISVLFQKITRFNLICQQ